MADQEEDLEFNKCRVNLWKLKGKMKRRTEKSLINQCDGKQSGLVLKSNGEVIVKKVDWRYEKNCDENKQEEQ